LKSALAYLFLQIPKQMLNEPFYLLTNPGFQEYFSRYGYLGIYIWFITIDQIAPIPEEITLIVIGYLASQGLINPILAGMFSVAAFITIDVVYFQLTKSGNKLFRKIRSKAENPKMKAYKTNLRNHMLKTLFALSFIPRLRLLVPVFVALAELKFKKFIVYSALSLSSFTAIYILIGILFHRSFSIMFSKLSPTDHVIFIIAMIVLMVILTIISIRKFK